MIKLNPCKIKIVHNITQSIFYTNRTVINKKKNLTEYRIGLYIQIILNKILLVTLGEFRCDL